MHKAMNVKTVKTWFEAVTGLYLQYEYGLNHIHIVDESDFAVRESYSSRALVDIYEQSSWKGYWERRNG